MPKGIRTKFFTFRLQKGDEEPEYFRMSTEITAKHKIPKNSIYSIINGRAKNPRRYTDFKIEKVKIPCRVYHNVDPSKLRFDVNF